MLRLPRIINSSLSARLSMMVVSAMGILLMSSLIIMLHYSRKSVKEEALQKASQALEGIVQRVDNILLSVEQASGNMFFNLLPHLNDSDMMMTFSQRLVESCPYISGCAIAFKPYYYGEDQEYFIAYVHHTNNGLASTSSPIIQAETFGNCPYTEQVWFYQPMELGKPCWLNPIVGTEGGAEPLTTFCLPIPGADGKPIGVIGVDVSLSILSQIVLEAKPSPNSYCTLISGDSLFIVHPDRSKLQQSVFYEAQRESNPSVKEAAEALISGETGYKPFTMRGTDYFVFYKPFERTAVPGRSMEKLDWNAGIIYPEDDVFGDYNLLLYYVFAITIIGLLLFLVLYYVVTRRQLLPLRMLTQSAHHIAQGNYDTTIPDTHRHDEIGRLQVNFQQMQQSLATQMGELEQLKTTLQERAKDLHTAYEHARKADRMKTAFLHNMTIKLVGPSNAICMDVNLLCNYSQEIGEEKTEKLTDDIQKNGENIAELLNYLIKLSDEEKGKEATHD